MLIEETLILQSKVIYRKELKVDQSVSHNGVCLTVTETNNNTHTVTAVKETLDKSSLTNFSVNDLINLERAMKLGERLDGHLVQGHVDGVAKCLGVSVNDGSWIYKFEFDISNEMLLIEKGSICINGVSLTVFDIDRKHISRLRLYLIHMRILHLKTLNRR